MSELSSKTLYNVTFVNQLTGVSQTDLVLANNLIAIEDEYSDILKIEPLGKPEVL